MESRPPEPSGPETDATEIPVQSSEPATAERWTDVAPNALPQLFEQLFGESQATAAEDDDTPPWIGWLSPSLLTWSSDRNASEEAHR